MCEPDVIKLNQIKKLSRPNVYEVKHILVNTKGREVASWDQPIIDSKNEGIVMIPCGYKNNIIHFLFKPTFEPGLINKVELNPHVVIEPGEIINKKLPDGKIVVKVKQSEEGGRFFQDKNTFSIVKVGEVKNIKDGFWLTLGEIRKLLDEEGWFTNESRSALSLLLPWM